MEKRRKPVHFLVNRCSLLSLSLRCNDVGMDNGHTHSIVIHFKETLISMRCKWCLPVFARPAEIVDLWLIADAYSLKMPHWQHNINFLTIFFFFSLKPLFLVMACSMMISYAPSSLAVLNGLVLKIWTDNPEEVHW